MIQIVNKKFGISVGVEWWYQIIPYHGKPQSDTSTAWFTESDLNRYTITREWQPGDKAFVNPQNFQNVFNEGDRLSLLFDEGKPSARVYGGFIQEKIQYFEIEVLTDSLLVMVPVASVDEVIRPVISKNAVSKKVYPIFKEKPEEAGTNWSRWYKVLTEKMTSGDVIQVAEVVRDLTHAQINKGISPALKRMLAKARTTLASEIACALKVDEETAIAKINQHLPEEDPEDGL